MRRHERRRTRSLPGTEVAAAASTRAPFSSTLDSPLISLHLPRIGFDLKESRISLHSPSFLVEGELTVVNKKPEATDQEAD